MPTYVALFNWTEQGVRSARDTVDRFESGRQLFEQMGLTIREVLWTVGPYDLVALADAPDDETVAAAMLALAGQGNVRTTTMRAFRPEEMRGVIGRMP